MSIELRQQMKLAQKLLMTQQLQQAIKLLQLNRMELSGALQTELEQNPMLEEVATDGLAEIGQLLAEESGGDSVEAPVTARVAGDDPVAVAEVNWEDYSNSFDADFSFAHETPAADAPSRLDFLAAVPGLAAFLAWQLTHLRLSEQDMDIARFILGNLDGHGFFDANIVDICQQVGCSEEEAEAMLRLVQNLDPPGVAARSIQESLLLQLERQGLEDSLAWRIAAEFFSDLSNRNLLEIARRVKVPLREVQAAAAVLAELVPYPGNEYSNEPTQEVVPDVYVFKIEDEFVVRLNTDDLPQLQLASEYQDLLAGGEAAAKNYLSEQKRNAHLLISALDYRHSTICRVMESIVQQQRDFFELGPGHLRPLILSDVAREVGVHESTVSRATANKYVETPHGIYELKYFFSATAAASGNGDDLTAENVKQRLAQLVRQENPAKPLSDGALAELLEKEGIRLARRTVAKYREQLRIPTVKFRRKE
ncbi:RNA polymerase factor sigma-54 [Candidatus Electronema sp. JC]|uniref:RNA polymerase factor sigma-54 n=1 Tax=Candidatus Electronema sp. JC TaxID=3401570 RepID=UPI003AA8753F